MSALDSAASQRVYLDNAATTWPKSPAAIAAAEKFVLECGATSGRGAYASAQAADRQLQLARTNIANLIGAPNSNDIAFCNSGTHALNAVLYGLLSPGDRVLTTSSEHNSVLRPLIQLQRTLQLELEIVPSTASGRADLAAAQERVSLWRPTWIVIGHASNVTGAANDLAAWSQFASQHEAFLVVDASQTLGYLRINLTETPVDAMAAAGHKGLRALAGTGFVFVAEKMRSSFRPLMFGGTGRFSERIDDMPDWPQRVEVGNLNLPGIVSMAAAADELLQADSLEAGWLSTFQHLVHGLMDLPHVRVLGDYALTGSQPGFVPVVSIQVDSWDVHDLAAVLDTSFGIEVRAGWHCAALVHEHIGSHAANGTLRLSTSRSTTIEQVEFAVRALREILE